MTDQTFNYRGLGISRQCYRMIAHEVWSEKCHTATVCSVTGFIMVLLIVVAFARSANGRVWMFGINSNQHVEIHEPTGTAR